MSLTRKIEKPIKTTVGDMPGQLPRYHLLHTSPPRPVSPTRAAHRSISSGGAPKLPGLPGRGLLRGGVLRRLNNNPNPLPGNAGSGGLPGHGGGLPGHGGGIGGIGGRGGLGKLFKKGKLHTDPNLTPHPPHFLGGASGGNVPAPKLPKTKPLFAAPKPQKPMPQPKMPPIQKQPKPMSSTAISLPSRGTATNSQLTGSLTRKRK